MKIEGSAIINNQWPGDVTGDMTFVAFLPTFKVLGVYGSPEKWLSDMCDTIPNQAFRPNYSVVPATLTIEDKP